MDTFKENRMNYIIKGSNKIVKTVNNTKLGKLIYSEVKFMNDSKISNSDDEPARKVYRLNLNNNTEIVEVEYCINGVRNDYIDPKGKFQYGFQSMYIDGRPILNLSYKDGYIQRSTTVNDTEYKSQYFSYNKNNEKVEYDINTCRFIIFSLSQCIHCINQHCCDYHSSELTIPKDVLELNHITEDYVIKLFNLIA